MLELRGQPALGPLIRVDHPVPELVQAGAVALVEADREARKVVWGGITRSAG